MNKISECEEQVLLVIYSSKEEPCLNSVMVDVNAKFNHEWKPQTVSTFLTRLVRKGYLSSQRRGRNTYYSVTISLKEYRKEKMEEMVNLLYDGDMEKAREDLV